MKRLLSIYQYLAPAILTPLTFWLWYQETGEHIQTTLMACMLPIFWAYIVPGVGTNILKVWEFDTRIKLGKFRPHHGFVFGSATSVFAWAVHQNASTGINDVLRYALILTSVLGFWNILYEIAALKAGILKVYNQPWADGNDHATIALDYSPWFFGGFGAAYGLSLAAFEWYANSHSVNWLTFALIFTFSLALSIAIPVVGYMQHSVSKHGHAGTRPINKKW